MTHYDELKQTFDKIGIKYIEDNSERNMIIRPNINKGYDKDSNKKELKVNKTIVLDCGCGYAGFMTEFYFDNDGIFLDHGVWE